MLSVHTNQVANYGFRNLRINSKAQQSVMEKLSSGYKINTGADGPSALILSERLRSQIDGLERSMRNTVESDGILDIMEGALGEIQSIFKRMKSLAIESANTGVLSQSAIAANQAEMDSALQAIERILDTTSYGGRKLLNNLQTAGTIGDNYQAILNAGKLADKYGDTLSSLLCPDTGSDGALFFIDPVQNHLPQFDENGILINGDTTFVFTGLGDENTALTIEFTEGTTIHKIVSTLKDFAATLPDVVMDNADNSFPVERSGSDTNRVEMDVSSLAALAAMTDEDATAALSEYMERFTRELEVDLEGWTKLSDYDKQLLRIADELANQSLKSLGSVSVATGTDENGNTVYTQFSLSDLYGGGTASLNTDPVAAMQIIDAADKTIAAQRASIGVARKMNAHLRSADQAARENLTRIESFIRDTDYSLAMIEYTRAQVLVQVGLNMVSQAQQNNQRQILDLFA